MAIAPSSPISAPRSMPRIPGHPLLGHLRTFNRERTEMLLRVGREQPEIASLRFGFVPCAIVSSPAIAHEMLATKPHAFVKSPGLAIFMRPLLGNGLLSSEHDVHAKQRKLLAPVFAHKRIASYAATMGERGARYASSLVHGAEIDAADDMMKLTLEIVGKTLFDTELGADSADEVGDALTIAMKTAMAQLSSLVPLPPSVPTPTNLKNRKAVARLDAILYRIIQQRRAQGGDRGDLLSMLLATQDESGAGMSDRQVRDEAMTLFLAGHETTANAMAWTLYLLAQHPEVRERLEAELDALGHDPSYEELRELPYTLAVLKESMRLYPPAYMLARRAIQDVELGGHRLRKHTIVILNVLGIHRRPDTFPDPDRFDPTRFLGDAERSLPRCAYMPFGAGPRICIGNHFALMEGHVLLATLARRVRLDLVGKADATMEPLVTLRPKGGIRMRVSVREAKGTRPIKTRP